MGRSDDALLAHEIDKRPDSLSVQTSFRLFNQCQAQSFRSSEHRHQHTEGV